MKKIDRIRFTRLLTVAVLVLAAAVLAGGASAASHKGAVVKLGQSKLGRIVVDSHGRTLYVSTHDRRSKSTCYGKCARAWPPLVTRGKPRAAMGARSALLGTSLRRDGRRQVTYHGHPLYYFAKDRKAGQALGAGLTAFGGRWDPVSAAGIAVRRPAMFKRPKLQKGLLTVVGTQASEKIALRLKSGDPGTFQVDVGDDGSANFSFQRKLITRIAVDSRAGDDLVRMDESNGAFTSVTPTTIAGGIGNDTLLGGVGAENILGGDGNDSLDGNGGNDRALMGAGDDVFVWDPGDGSDVVEGEAGADTMRFNGANIAEQVDLSANGNRLRFFRTQANITMDTAGLERVDFNALGGADLVTVNDLTGTDVGNVNVDLASALGGAVGDGDDRSRRRQRHQRQRHNRRQRKRLWCRRLRTADCGCDSAPGADRRARRQRARRQRPHLGGRARSPGDLTDPRRRRRRRHDRRKRRVSRLLLGGDGNDSLDGNGGNDRGADGRRRRRLRLGSRRRQRCRRR